MNRALSAPLTGASIDWGTLRLTQEASPSKMPPLFADSRVLAYAMVDPASLPSDHSTPITLTVKATSPDGPIELVRGLEYSSYWLFMGGTTGALIPCIVQPVALDESIADLILSLCVTPLSAYYRPLD